MSNEMQSLGARIRAARERQMPKMSQQQLADAVGVGVKTVNNWETGRTKVQNRIARLEVVLGSLDDVDVDPHAREKAEIRELRHFSDEQKEALIAAAFPSKVEPADPPGLRSTAN